MAVPTACKLCGGTAGRLNENDTHNLCAARLYDGQPTPSLGDRCRACNGAGTIGLGGVMLDFDLGPATIARSIEAQFPPCATCKGTGWLSRTPTRPKRHEGHCQQCGARFMAHSPAGDCPNCGHEEIEWI